MLIDTHCHLDFDWFDEDRDAVVERAQAAGVTQTGVPGLYWENCRTNLALTEKYDAVFAAVSVYPNFSAHRPCGVTRCEWFALAPAVMVDLHGS